MLKAAGSHAAHLIVEALLGLAGLAVIAGCVLAWRLGQGPIDITALVQREAPRLAESGTRVTIGAAALTWEGFHDPESPLDIRWRNIAISSAAGGPPILLPQGRVTIATSRLLLGQIVPRVIDLDHPSVHLVRDAAGTLRVDFGQTPPPQATRRSAPPPSAPGGATGGATAGATGGSAAVFLRDLANPTHRGSGLTFLAQLRQIHIRDAEFTVQDAIIGSDWHATASHFDLDRQRDGRITGTAGIELSQGAAHASLHAQAELTQAGTHVTASTSPLSPAALATIFPGLAALTAPVGLQLDATLSPQLALLGATAMLHAGSGVLHAGTGQVALRDADIAVQAAPAPGGISVTMPNFRITLVPPTLATGPAPTLSGHATLTRDTAGIRAAFALDLDHAAFADLPAYWPPGTGGGSRPWLVENITTGLAQDGHVQGTLTAAPDFSNLAVTSLGGTISATGLSVHWLRPVPPIEHASGKLTIENADTLQIDMPTGTQGPIQLSDGHIRIIGLSKKDQVGDISVHAEGGLADTLALLNHKRLGLLSRRPIAMQNPSGKVATTITVRLPLDARVKFDDITIAAKARLSDVHLGGVAAGRDLDDGQLALAVDTNDLKITGTGTVSAIPATLAVMMDFRDGPPSQVLEHVTAQGTATPAEATQAGLPDGIFTEGTAALSVDYSDRRDRSGEVDLAANLRSSALTTPLGWTKGAGQTATASARLTLFDNSLTGIDQIRASGPNLAIASHVETQGGALRVLRLDQLRIGQTNAAGSIAMPRTKGDRWRINLRGPTLDLSTFFKKRDADSTPDDDTRRGTPWTVDIAFDQVLLAKDEVMNTVALHADDDGLHVQDGELSAGPTGQVRASITPLPPATPGGQSPGRKLIVDASEAGGVLLAAGVADNIRDGHLRVDAVYADTQPHAPLRGTATLEQFRITNAPAVGRLLKAATLYGAVDLLRGPGLGFQKALVPFRWQQRVLHLDSARAFSASLGITAQGDIDLRQRVANVSGTIVPAYFFNQLLGKIPVVGKLFSPEKGGGVFAATYSVRGKLADPKIGVNALSALTPGFLRKAFGSP
jgi:hypothetical protein